MPTLFSLGQSPLPKFFHNSCHQARPSKGRHEVKTVHIIRHCLCHSGRYFDRQFLTLFPVLPLVELNDLRVHRDSCHLAVHKQGIPVTDDGDNPAQ